jgi:MFS family permease
VGIALSALGNGLVLPYTFIYFHNVRDFPIAVAGLIASYGAFTSLAISPLVGNFIDKWGPKPVLLASLAISSVGYCGLSLVKTIPRHPGIVHIKIINEIINIPKIVTFEKFLEIVELNSEIKK